MMRGPAVWRAGMGGAVLAATLAGCSPSDPADRKTKAEAPLVRSGPVRQESGGVEGATPMADRVAKLGLLNKRNGLVRDIELKPGESIRIGRVIVRLRACETTAPWEATRETGAFVQLLVQEQRDDKWYRIFSGWLFRERPERNIVQHPIYDVFVNSCTMSFPGGDPLPAEPSPAPAAKASSARQSPAGNDDSGTGTPAPAPAPPPAPASAEPEGDNAA